MCRKFDLHICKSAVGMFKTIKVEIECLQLIFIRNLFPPKFVLKQNATLLYQHFKNLRRA